MNRPKKELHKLQISDGEKESNNNQWQSLLLDQKSSMEGVMWSIHLLDSQDLIMSFQQAARFCRIIFLCSIPSEARRRTTMESILKNWNMNDDPRTEHCAALWCVSLRNIYLHNGCQRHCSVVSYSSWHIILGIQYLREKDQCHCSS